MSLSGFKRWMARSFMGNEMLNNPSWERARFHLEKAVALDSTVPVYRLDLAYLYRERDDDSAAREQLLALLVLDPRDPFDQELQEEARELLSELPDG